MNTELFNKNWRAKVEKSVFVATTTPSSEKRLYEKVEDGYKLTVNGINPDGTEYEWGYTALRDGETFPIYGREDADSIIAHKVTEEITIGDFLKDGQIVAIYKRKLSEDGKSLTVIFSGIDKENKPYFNVIEYSV